MVRFFDNVGDFSDVLFHAVCVGFRVRMRFNVYKRFD